MREHLFSLVLSVHHSGRWQYRLVRRGHIGDVAFTGMSPVSREDRMRRVAIGLFVAGLLLAIGAAVLEFGVQVGYAQDPELSSSIAALPVFAAAISLLTFGGALYFAGPGKRRMLGILTGSSIAVVSIGFGCIRWQVARSDFHQLSGELEKSRDFEIYIALLGRDQMSESLRRDREYLRFAQGWVSGSEWEIKKQQLDELDQRFAKLTKAPRPAQRQGPDR